MIISETAYSRWFGTATVNGLSKEEREAVRSGETVLFDTGTSLSGGNHGTTWRKVVHRNGRFFHRVPSEIELRELKKITDFDFCDPT